MSDLPAGPELDALIINKVMGWESQKEWWAYFLANLPEMPDFEPSKNIQAAMYAVEKLKHHDYVFVAIQGSDSAFAGRLHYRTPVTYDLLIEAETLPLAICRAALKAVQA